MNGALRPAEEVRKRIEENKKDLQKEAVAYVTALIPNIRKQIDIESGLMEYHCSVKLSNVNLAHPFVKSAYSDAFTKLFQPFGYQFSFSDRDGVSYLNVFWNEDLDNFKRRI